MAWGNLVHRWWVRVLAIAIALGMPVAVTPAAVVTVAWDASSEPDVAGYKLYLGTSSRTYPVVLDAGNLTSLSVLDLQEGLTYYFAATAYDTEGLESDFSVEISYTIPPLRIPTTATLVSSANPARPGETVTFTFTVRAEGSLPNVLSGLASFRIGETATSVSLVGGVAMFATSTLPAGRHAVSAEFAGDVNFLAVTSRLSAEQVINTPPVVRTDQINRIPPNGTKIQVFNLLTNDSDGDGHGLTLASVASQSAGGASVTRRNNWIYYVPPEGLTNADSFGYSASDGLGAGVAGTVNVRVVEPQPALNVNVSEDGGSYRLRFDGAPGVTYRIEFSEAEPPNWQQLDVRTADEFGIVELTDTPPPQTPLRTYRSVAIY